MGRLRVELYPESETQQAKTFGHFYGPRGTLGRLQRAPLYVFGMAIETAYTALFSCVDFVLHRYFALPDQEERNVFKYVPVVPTYFSDVPESNEH